MIAAGEQSPDHPGFVGPEAPYDCHACIGWYAEQYQFPHLLADAEEEADLPDPLDLLAWDIYAALSDQRRAAGMDVGGIDYAVLPLAWELYRVPRRDHLRLFERLAAINREAMAWHAEKRRMDERSRALRAEGNRAGGA